MIFGFGCCSGSGVVSGSSFTALQNPLRLRMYFKVWAAISILQPGRLTSCFNLYIFGCSSTVGPSSITGSTGSFVI